MQPATSTTLRRTLTIVRRPVRRPFTSYRAPSHASGIPVGGPEVAESTNFRASLADAFLALGSSVGAATAQAQSNAFYRSSGQRWARGLEDVPSERVRASIAAAFRMLGAGVGETAAHARTIAFYRGAGQAWAANLG
jgi:hypothetical protein